MFFFFFQAEDGIRDLYVTGVQTCALPIYRRPRRDRRLRQRARLPHRDQGGLRRRRPRDEGGCERGRSGVGVRFRSEEHTSELQSRRDLVCRLLLEKKKKKKERESQSESAR